MHYARIENDDVVETREMPSNFVAAEVAHKEDWRPLTDGTDPPLSPTEQYSGYDYGINAGVTRTRAVVALTQEELDAAAASNEVAALRAVVDAIDTTNDIFPVDIRTVFEWLQKEFIR